jgi:hypothetical protein
LSSPPSGSSSAMPEISPAPTSGVRSMAHHRGTVAGMFVCMAMAWILL